MTNINMDGPIKDDETLTNDLKQITKDFDPDYENVQEIVEWIKR